jgi:hypothetical protein
MTMFLAAAICCGSNLKFKVLGEPLVFSDAAAIGGMFRFPKLYLFAMPLSARLGSCLGVIVLVAGVAASFVPRWLPHGQGFLIFGVSLLALWTTIPSTLMREPDLEGDVARHGVALTMFLYWRRWMTARVPAFPPLPTAPSATADLVIIIQSESFCDPQEILQGGQPLPNLERARAGAWTWGNLDVDCFGAYTMRTEYGVLCGVEESSLGFSRYNPFLIAGGRPELALPAKFLGHHCVFLHPYDLRFFGRKRLMKQLGFAELMDASAFARPPGDLGYVSDRTLAQKLLGWVRGNRPVLLYTVTMENHGPWPSANKQAEPTGLDTYLQHLKNADAMLGDLVNALILSRRSAVLAFFGDHRPSIPGFVEDGKVRHTPYVLLRFDSGKCAVGPGRADQTPAGLHHAICACAAL